MGDTAGLESVDAPSHFSVTHSDPLKGPLSYPCQCRPDDSGEWPPWQPLTKPARAMRTMGMRRYRMGITDDGGGLNDHLKGPLG